MTVTAQSFYDPGMPVEIIPDVEDEDIHIILPSDIWINCEQAECLANALIEIAGWLRKEIQKKKKKEHVETA